MFERLLFVARPAFYAAFVVGVAISAAGLFGSWHVVFDATNHFRPHFILLSLIGLAAAWPIDRGRAVLAAFGCLTLNLFALQVHLASAAPVAAADAKNTITLATFNVWGRNDDVANIEAFLRTHEPGVIVLQEVSLRKAQFLEDLRAIYPYQKNCAEDLHCRLALLSKHPFEAAGTVSRTSGGPPIIWAQFGGQANNRASTTTVVGTHFHVALPTRTQFRDKERLVDFVEQIDGNVVLLGDFNATPWSHVIGDLTDRTGLRPLHRFLPTWPAQFAVAQFPIDLLFVSAGIENHGVWRGSAGGSDHRPVIAEIALPDQVDFARVEGKTQAAGQPK